MSSEIKADLFKDKSGTKTLATLSNSSATLHSDVTFPSGTPVKYQKNQTVISSEQPLTASFQDVTGSSLTYTPASGYSYIVYECSFIFMTPTASSAPLFAVKFLVDGAITKNQDSVAPYVSGVTGEYSSPKHIYRLIYSDSSWTSDKVVKMQARQYQTGTGTHHTILHKQRYNPNQSNGVTMGSGTYYTDVDVTIYSVM